MKTMVTLALTARALLALSVFAGSNGSKSAENGGITVTQSFEGGKTYSATYSIEGAKSAVMEKAGNYFVVSGQWTVTEQIHGGYAAPSTIEATEKIARSLTHYKSLILHIVEDKQSPDLVKLTVTYTVPSKSRKSRDSANRLFKIIVAAV